MYATQAKDSLSKELLSLLEDEPYRIVTHHGLAQTGDYDAVCDCIQRSYAPSGSELEWQLKVRTRVQKVGESLMEFCGALRGMADKAFPAWPAEQLQDLLRNQFIQRLSEKLKGVQREEWIIVKNGRKRVRCAGIGSLVDT